MKAIRLPFVSLIIIISILTIAEFCVVSEAESEVNRVAVYEKWRSIGRIAATRSVALIKEKLSTPKKQNLIVITDAGYAEVNGSYTQGALDGLMEVTGVSRGRNTLVEIHATASNALWFAVYDKESGYCAYLQVDPVAADKTAVGDLKSSPKIFAIESIERIDADYLYENASAYKAKFEASPFGGNEFRIVTIVNGIAAGAPPYVIRAFEFHDHYCPGVTSGILMAEYLKRRFPPGKSGYFVHSVDPWCKEDSLMVLLNATPGKGGYAVSYPSDADRAARVPEAEDAATIVYRQDDKTGQWEGLIMGFEFANLSCPKTGDNIIDKLCADLWYLERLEKPEDFVKIIKRFRLPPNVSPKDWAGPGADPLKMLDMYK